MKNRLIVVTALFALLLVGNGCGSSKTDVTPPPVDRSGPPNAVKPQDRPANAAEKPTADDGLDDAFNDLSAAE